MKEKAKLTEAEIERLLTSEFPQMFNPQGGFAIDAGLVPRLPRPQALRSAIFAPGRDDRGDDHDGARRPRALRGDPCQHWLGTHGGDDQPVHQFP